ncbi:hypothetical protein HORM4_440029 [Vibrio harveyi]|nr:hypothetical protein HORM4_440029 [Vibrio harveyi]
MAVSIPYSHIVWTPKYRFRVLKNNIGKKVYRCIYVYCNQLGLDVKL